MEENDEIFDMKDSKFNYKEMIMELVKENKRKEQVMNEMIENLKMTANNTTNNNITNNTMNNNININMFLNEKCKDAINFSDFIDRIEITNDDLENNAQLGFVNGISKILMDNLRTLDLYERPIHCTDVKREILYIKDQDMWEKEESSDKLNGAIKEVSRKSIGSLLKWKKENPEYEDMDSDFSNKCIVIQQQSSAGLNSDNLYPKVITNLAKENKISKEQLKSKQ